jgi:uncharacterized protein YbjT (DUF2867 family)
MTDKKILVVGATGAQGGSVARHLLSKGKYSVRCITRNPNSEKAKALSNAGAEVVQCNLDDADNLYAVTKDCWGVFGVTNFWEHFEKEFQQGKNLVDAVSHSQVKHFVLSTLPHANKITKGALVVPHFDMKGQIETYAREAHLGTTFVHVAFYYENYLSYFHPQKQEDGSFSFGFPQGDTRLAAVSVEDMGGVVTSIFDNPSHFQDRVVGIVGDDIPPAQYAVIMSQIFGKKVVYNYIPKEIFASFDFPGADDLANMFEFNRLHIPVRQSDKEESKSLYLDIRTFASWLEENKEKFNLG